MKAISKLTAAFILTASVLTFSSCDPGSDEQYFSFDYNGTTWSADPEQFLATHNDVNDYFDIIAEATDGSSMLIRFAPVSNGEGAYDLSGNINGNDTHVFFRQDPGQGELDMTSYETSWNEVQTDAMTITAIDRPNTEFNIVEGTFAFTLYPLYPASNPVGAKEVTNGKFKVKFEFGSVSGPSL